MQEMLRNLVMAFWSDGGQGTARRNAWAAMVTDAKRSRDRADAEATVAVALTAHQLTGAGAVAASLG
jgi:hypothetical protein